MPAKGDKKTAKQKQAVKPKKTAEKKTAKKEGGLPTQKMPEISVTAAKETPKARLRGRSHFGEAKARTKKMEEPERYWEAVGRRKTAIARVRLFTRGEKGIWANDKSHSAYFQNPGLSTIVEDPLKKMKSVERFRVTAKISGGGLHAQAEAMRHGISRALVIFNPDFRKRLKRAGFLKRDPRMKERKKFGLKGARRAPQWQKR